MQSTSRFYTGVGARKTPVKIQNIMTRIAVKMDTMGLILRSGGAIGADKAFAMGATHKHIYYASDATPFAMSMAEHLHGAWDSVGEYGRKLHGRNLFQVMGRTVDIKSSVLICWTPDGCICHKDRTKATGGTGTAISIADRFGVPVYNLKLKEHMEIILKWLD